MQKNTRKILLSVLAYVLVFIGITGFALGFLLVNETITYNNELPLGEIQGFAVDDSKNIYVGIAFYSAIQKYDSNGYFIKHWNVGQYTGEGMFNIDIENGRFIRISATRTSNHVLFDEYGNVIESQVIPKIFTKTEHDYKTFNAANGEKYELKGLLLSRIVKVHPTYSTVIKQNILLELYKGPRVIFLYGMGYLILYLIKGNFKIAHGIALSLQLFIFILLLINL